MAKDAVDTTSREREGLLGTLALGVDTCGPSGSVALARIDAGRVEILGQTELAGKSYSATLVAAVGELLSHAGARVWQLNAIAVTSGPGSFTGVRVGLSAVKGLAEPSGVPVVAVSRLAVLAQKAGVDAAALDAHRHEVFLRAMGEGSKVREILAGRAELQALNPVPRRVGVCDDASAEILTAVWPDTELVRVEAPMAKDVLQLAAPKILGREFAELALLDGHYLRRSDAEIFGEPAGAGMPAHTPAGRHNG
jgi:tRNA threonylcarbamoyladenosine biosynthesis protein TsaB